MSFELSRTTSLAQSIKGSGLGPFRTPRSRAGQNSTHSRIKYDSFSSSHDSRPVSRASTTKHRRTSSYPEQPFAFATPKTHALQIDRQQQKESITRASSPPISGSHLSRRGQSVRSSLATLARSGSFSVPRTPKGRRSTETPDLIPDDDDHSDGSRFDLLSDDPFRSETPIAILDIEEAPPVPPKQLYIIPPSQLIIPEELKEPPTPSEGSRTPTSGTVLAMKNAFNRLTLTGKPRIRLLSFIKEAKSPLAEVGPIASPPKLELSSFTAGEPLFDVSGFELPDLPSSRRSMKVDGRSLGHAAPPPPLKSSPPVPSLGPVSSLPGPSALQLDLHEVTTEDGEFEGYVLESPTEGHEPLPEVEQLPEIQKLPSPKEPPNWILKFREELEALAGEALSITSFPDKLVLELPEEPGLRHRRTLVFTDADPDELEESTPELTSDSISVSSQGRPPRPTRAIPPIPVQEAPEEFYAELIGFSAASSSPRPSPHLNREACTSLLSIHSSSTWDPSQPIPSIPDQDSLYPTSDDDQTIREAEADIEPHVFEPSLSKADLIEEAIRKIQRKAETERLRVIEEDESEAEYDTEYEPVIVERGPTLTRHISNPFATSSTPEPQKPPRKVSLLRKRVLSRSLGSPRPAPETSSHSRSASVPTTSEILRERNVVVAGRLPLTSRSIERELPSLPPPVAPKPPRAQFAYDDFYQGPPSYLTKSTPTFEVVSGRHRSFQPPAVYYRPSSPQPLAYHPDSRDGFFGGF